MKKLIILALVVISSLAQAQSNEYPRNPLPELTPGELCTQPIELRYPEQIAYCGRFVDTAMKDMIFEDYRRAGYILPRHHRSSYKIDHFIPLCAGGANTPDNLWPQHKTIFDQTDSFEKLACDKLATGKISQREVVDLIIKVKMDLRELRAAQQRLSRIR